MLNNPIWFREQQTWKARTRRLPWWRRGRHLTLPLIWIITLGACCLLNCLNRDLNWRTLHESLQIGTIAACYLQIGYLTFRSLIAGASVLVRERELQTMDTLLSSPLPVPQLVIGKWLSAAAPLLSELALTLPVALLATQWTVWLESSLPWYSHDDLALWQAGDCFVLCLALVVFLTGLGVLLSTRSANSGRAATQAVLVGLALTLGNYVVDLLVQVFSGASDLHPFLCWLNPWTAFWSIFYAGHWPSATAIGPHLWMGTVSGYIFLAFACTRLSVYRLSRPARG